MNLIKTLPHAIIGNESLQLLFSFLVALIIAYVAIPAIVNVARAKDLFDEPKARGAHDVRTPTFGGTAIYAGLIISSMIFMNLTLPGARCMQYVIAGSMIIFLIGLKDDIQSIAPRTKLIGQFVAGGMLIDLGDVRFTDLHGFLGIHHIDYVSSAFLTLFVIIVIVNAFNLIDGVDGLASGIGMVCATAFGVWFYLVGMTQLAVLAASLVGGLAGFFYFNVFSKTNKIFMGDTGSLLLGYFMAVLVIKFNEANINLDSIYATHSAPAISIGILVVPLFDTARVFTIRVLRGRSPFSPDRNHVHHRLLKILGSHRSTSFTIVGVNIGFVALCVFLKDMPIWSLLLILLSLATLLSYIPIYKIQKQNKAKGQAVRVKNK